MDRGYGATADRGRIAQTTPKGGNDTLDFRFALGGLIPDSPDRHAAQLTYRALMRNKLTS